MYPSGLLGCVWLGVGDLCGSGPQDMALVSFGPSAFGGNGGKAQWWPLGLKDMKNKSSGVQKNRGFLRFYDLRGP